MPSAGAILCLLAMGMSVWAVVSAASWPWKAALFPVVVGVPVLLLAGAELYLMRSRRQAPPRAEPADLLPEPRPVDPTLARRRTLAMFGWIGGLFLLIVGVGFLAAVPAFALLYLRLQAREGWPVSLAMAGAAWGLVYGLFVRLLHLPLGQGYVQSWLGF